MDDWAVSELNSCEGEDRGSQGGSQRGSTVGSFIFVSSFEVTMVSSAIHVSHRFRGLSVGSVRSFDCILEFSIPVFLSTLILGSVHIWTIWSILIFPAGLFEVEPLIGMHLRFMAFNLIFFTFNFRGSDFASSCNDSIIIITYGI